MADRVQLQPAYVLHRRPYRESSFLIEAFSLDYGRVGLVARGARRGKDRSQALLQAFVPVLLSWSARGELGTLTGIEANGVAKLPGGRSLYSGFYLNELLIRLLTRFDPHPELFAHYATALSQLAGGAEWDEGAAIAPVETALRLFEKRLLDEIGYGLVFFDEEGDDLDFDDRGHYEYRRDLGPRQVATSRDDAADGFQPGVVVSGSTLTALREEAQLDETGLKESKRLMRHLIEPLLGGRPLQTRSFFTGP